MPASVRKGDIGSGHSCHYPPKATKSGSPNVFVNDIPAVRVRDSFALLARWNLKKEIESLVF